MATNNEELVKSDEIVKSDERDVTKSVSVENTCDNKTCGLKKRNLSISTQIKTTHNKSEIGLKQKKCMMHRKQKNIKNNDVIADIAAPLAEHILMKTF